MHRLRHVSSTPYAYAIYSPPDTGVRGNLTDSSGMRDPVYADVRSGRLGVVRRRGQLDLVIHLRHQYAKRCISVHWESRGKGKKVDVHT